MAGAEQPSLIELAAPFEQPRWAAVAQVLVDTPLPHLDRPFDYGVPPELAGDAQVGVRVKVLFAGTERDGYIVGLTEASRYSGQLAPVRRVASAVPLLSTDLLALARGVATRYAGTTSDVLRLAIPPRHATAEKAVLAAAPPTPGVGTDDGAPTRADEAVAGQEEWAGYLGGEAFLRRLRAGESPRAVWSALPSAPGAADTDTGGRHWARATSAAIAATRAGGRGAVAVLPDARDVAALSRALTEAGIDHEILSADQGRSARYRRYLLATLGRTAVVVGTRSAAFVPVRDLGLLVCWDDGDDLLAEPRAPYPHAREVLTMRAELQGAAVLFAGFAQTTQTRLLLQQGWARALVADRAHVRSATPRVTAPTDVDLAREGAAAAARFPRPAWELVRRALERGPVLVQVARAGYLPVVACARCREPARCAHCHGPLALPSADGSPTCRWCGKHAVEWRCTECGHDALRASKVGSGRTAEELGRAFPGVRVVASSGDRGVVGAIADEPQLVVATPGAEPVAEHGYRAAVLLDAAALLMRPELDASVEALRRWLNAAALVRPDGEVMLLGSPPAPLAQTFVRWDPAGWAERELTERTELRFPPVARIAGLTGPWPAVRDLLRRVELPDGAEVLGPAPLIDERGDESARALVRAPRAQGLRLATAVRAASATRSAHKAPGTVRVQIDPVDIW